VGDKKQKSKESSNDSIVSCNVGDKKYITGDKKQDGFC
jgi:hypothetical protein